VLGSIERLKRKWFCPAEKFGVFQQNMPKGDPQTSKFRNKFGWLKFGRIDRLEGAPKVGALGDIGRVGGNQSDFGCDQGWTASLISFFTWWNKESRVLIFPVFYNLELGLRLKSMESDPFDYL